MTNETAVAKIVRYAKKWGIPVLKHSPLIVFDNYWVGPGKWSIVNWTLSPKIVAKHDVSDDSDESLWPYLLHELAHAVHPKPPKEVEELEDTTGFEILSILYLDLPMEDWNKWQSEYDINVQIGCVYANIWSEAPPSWQRRRLILACEEAHSLGHFLDGEPSYYLYRLVDGKPVELKT